LRSELSGASGAARRSFKGLVRVELLRLGELLAMRTSRVKRWAQLTHAWRPESGRC
jgi:hypothetical protein